MKDFYKKLSGCLKDTELSGNKELIQLLTSMNNRIIELEKQNVDKHDFQKYKKKKRGFFSRSQSSRSKRK